MALYDIKQCNGKGGGYRKVKILLGVVERCGKGMQSYTSSEGGIFFFCSIPGVIQDWKAKHGEVASNLMHTS